MGIRMLPVGSVFSRFPRVVRDLAASLGKEIALEVEGEETELDKSVVEGMSDPLTHFDSKRCGSWNRDSGPTRGGG